MDPKINGYQRGLASMVYKFFDKITIGLGINNDILAKELHKPIIKKFKRKKVYFSFKDNIWGIDLADLSLLVDLIKELNIYYVLLFYLLDIHGLFLKKIQKEIVLLKDLKKYYIILIGNRIKYG